MNPDCSVEYDSDLIKAAKIGEKLLSDNMSLSLLVDKLNIEIKDLKKGGICPNCVDVSGSYKILERKIQRLVTALQASEDHIRSLVEDKERLTKMMQYYNIDASNDNSSISFRNNKSNFVHIDFIEHISQWIGNPFKFFIVYQTGDHQCCNNINDGADYQRINHSLGQIPLCILAFLGRGGYGIKSNIGKEYRRYAL